MRNDFAGSSSTVPTSGSVSKNHNNSDEALIAKIASGNRLAMQVLYARHHTRIYRFILRLGRSDAMAEDLTSDAFLSVCEHAPRCEARSAVTTWLLEIARYRALADLRRRPTTSSDDANADISDPAD